MFASVSRTMLMKVPKLTEYQADLCFDMYESSSIKDIKRRDKGSEKIEQNFTFGSRQTFPSGIDDLPQISEIKKEFLKTQHENPVCTHIIDDKIFYCSENTTCETFYVNMVR